MVIHDDLPCSRAHTSTVPLSTPSSSMLHILTMKGLLPDDLPSSHDATKYARKKRSVFIIDRNIPCASFGFLAMWRNISGVVVAVGCFVHSGVKISLRTGYFFMRLEG